VSLYRVGWGKVELVYWCREATSAGLLTAAAKVGYTTKQRLAARTVKWGIEI